MATESPERAWARASVQPQNRPYSNRARLLISSTTIEPFLSHNWRT